MSSAPPRRRVVPPTMNKPRPVQTSSRRSGGWGSSAEASVIQTLGDALSGNDKKDSVVENVWAKNIEEKKQKEREDLEKQQPKSVTHEKVSKSPLPSASASAGISSAANKTASSSMKRWGDESSESEDDETPVQEPPDMDDAATVLHDNRDATPAKVVRNSLGSGAGRRWGPPPSSQDPLPSRFPLDHHHHNHLPDRRYSYQYDHRSRGASAHDGRDRRYSHGHDRFNGSHHPSDRDRGWQHGPPPSQHHQPYRRSWNDDHPPSHRHSWNDRPQPPHQHPQRSSFAAPHYDEFRRLPSEPYHRDSYRGPGSAAQEHGSPSPSKEKKVKRFTPTILKKTDKPATEENTTAPVVPKLGESKKPGEDKIRNEVAQNEVQKAEVEEDEVVDLIAEAEHEVDQEIGDEDEDEDDDDDDDGEDEDDEDDSESESHSDSDDEESSDEEDEEESALRAYERQQAMMREEAEKERIRLELQQKQQADFLKHLAAARAVRERHWKEVQESKDMEEEDEEESVSQHQASNVVTKSSAKKVGSSNNKRPILRIPAEDESAKKERRKHMMDRSPRTKGVLFSRKVEDGELVRIQRDGTVIPRPQRKLNKKERKERKKLSKKERKAKRRARDEDSDSDDDDDDDGHEVTVEFVPAPIPKVSAWSLGLPKSIADLVQPAPPITATQSVQQTTAPKHDAKNTRESKKNKSPSARSSDEANNKSNAVKGGRKQSWKEQRTTVGGLEEKTKTSSEDKKPHAKSFSKKGGKSPFEKNGSKKDFVKKEWKGKKFANGKNKSSAVDGTKNGTSTKVHSNGESGGGRRDAKNPQNGKGNSHKPHQGKKQFSKGCAQRPQARAGKEANK